MNAYSILTIVAIVIAPYLAVWGNGYLDREREKRARKMDIFRTLMRTRSARLLPDHVGALNLVEIEFAEHREVMETWKALHKHFGTAHHKHSNEENDLRRYEERLDKERLDFLAEMLYSMAKVLKFKVEQMEILNGGYYPQGYVDMEREQLIARRYVVGLALGEKSVPVEITSVPNTSDNPDPPKSP